MTDSSTEAAGVADIRSDPVLERPFTRPSSSPYAPWLAVLLVLVGAALIVASIQGPHATLGQLQSVVTRLIGGSASFPEPSSRLELGAPGAPDAPAVSGARTSPLAGSENRQDVRPDLLADTAPPAPPGPAVRKCVQGGRTTFTDAPCPGGAHAQDLDLPVATASPATPANITLYRCRTHAGAYYWSRAHCHAQGARVDRMTPVPASLSLARQTRLAEQQRLQAGAATASAPARVRRTLVANALPRCQQIDKAIDAIDAETRQPLSGPRQDRLREQRRRLRQEQFTLRCR
ncbi:MAG: hypothetical protein R3E99_09915 [Burkholderiaceae bacterium]